MPAKLCAQETVFKNTLVYSQKDGLSSPNIHKIVQDKYSFLWVATQDGLNRFDGKQFTRYHYDQKLNRKLFSSDIRDLIADNETGLLWVICNQGGVNTIEMATGNCKTAYAYPLHHLQDQWKTCAAYYNGKIFIGTSGGLEILDISSGQFIGSIFLSKPDEACRQAFSSDIRTLSISKDGIMAMGLPDKGIFFYDINKATGFLFDAGKIQLSGADLFWPLCGEFTKDNLFYCGTQSSLYILDHKKQQVIKPNNNWIVNNNTPVTALTLANDEILFAGNFLTKADVQDNTVHFIRPNFYEAESWFKNITCIFRDDKANTWIGSLQGLCIIKNNEPVFRAVRNDPVRYNNELGHVFSLCVLDSATILTGTENGLFSVDPNFGLRHIYGKDRVQNIVRINKDAILVSGYNGSRLFRNGKTEPLSNLFPELLPYESWQFNSYVRVNDSISLLGSESNNGVLEWNTTTSVVSHLHAKAKKNKQLPTNNVNSIFINRKGNPLILSDYFITVYAPSGNLVFKLKDKTVDGIYMQMEETPGDYWIAAYGRGLVRTDDNFTVKMVYSVEEGLSNSGLYSIFNYKDSLLFLTSNYGISVFNIKTEKFSSYFEEDGLQNNTYEEASRDIANKVFYAGGANGYTRIEPQKLIVAKDPPKIYFTRMLIEESSGISSDTSNVEATSFTISPRSVQVKIFFSAIHYQNPKRVQYSYKIKELGSHWIDLGDQNFVTLVGRSPGTYHLEVRAFNEDGVPSEIKELTLVFLPKWYQTGWFRTLIVLSILAIGYALYRMRINQFKKEQQIRSKLASDLHDDLGSTMNSVKVYANLAIMEKQADKYLPLIKDGTQHAITGIRDIIWVLDDTKDSIEQLLSRINTFASPLCEANGIRYKQDISDNARDHKLGQEERRNLYMMLKEAVNNAVKYSGGSVVEITVSLPKNKPVIQVKDDGKGFDTNAGSEGNGLKNMRRRAREIKYQMEITATPGGGTSLLFEKL